MTENEKKELQTKIDKFDRLTNRISYLKDAIRRLSNKNITNILLPIGDDENNKIMFAETKNITLQGFSSVCWSNKEEGLISTIRSLIIEELDKRLKNSIQELEEL